ncbi:MAG: alanine racemase [Armatimonadetes bacterium]|nr:alanine racemase [Armatimonadota bacterium]
MQPYPRTWVDIDLPSLAHNLQVVRTRIDDPGVAVALVTKADAYGHGLVPISRYALRNGADWAAVATVQEGIALRDAGVDAPIMALSPILDIEAEQAVFYDLDVLTENVETAYAMDAASQAVGKTARVHLKVDTGLHRFGADWRSSVALAKRLKEFSHINLCGIVQHFADSSRDHEFTLLQIKRWEETLEAMTAAGIHFEFVQAANSAGTIKYPQSRGNLVRVGIIGYGIDPFNLLEGEARPVLRWTARVTALRRAAAGDKVGYSGTFTLQRDSVLATVGAGYGDGYPRTLSSKGLVEIRNKQAQVLGLVCMDQIIVDVTDAPGAAIGDEVLLIGDSVQVPLLATLADTNSHEIVTRIMSRVPRRYHY